jgi:hypothetical protein
MRRRQLPRWLWQKLQERHRPKWRLPPFQRPRRQREPRFPQRDSTEVDAAATGEAEAAALATEVVPPQPPKSERQIACERKRGSWADTGGGFMICITPTRDSGKRCTRESQCENVCLARSQTCAPVTPLMGCHEILQDDGSRATQCID